MVSIYSLMADGRELSSRLRSDEQTVCAVQPYVRFVRGNECCEFTGLRLLDIWRYFRHTWATPYKSVPGRSLLLLVRDRAAEFHPIIGIAALSSATVGLKVRDQCLGWTFEQFLTRLQQMPSASAANWIRATTDAAIDEIYKEDLLEEGVLTLATLKFPVKTVVQKLQKNSEKHRKDHYRFMQGRDYKKNGSKRSAPDWEGQARTLLFRAKREQELAHLLQIRSVLNRTLRGEDTFALKDFVSSTEGKETLAKLIRKAKAGRVGTAIADLSVCGAIPPYSHILAGKLVAMLTASPEIIREYRRRYGKVSSIIASSMAGRDIVRPAELAFISTTSLYGRRPNQYDRIKIPIERIEPSARGHVRFDYLGKTRGVGTFQFGAKTVEAMSRFLSQTSKGQRVNSVFGEGVNPRLRKIRHALDELGLPAGHLLDHGAPRLVYGVSLLKNLTEYLMGLNRRPAYFVPPDLGCTASTQIGNWWFERWVKPRLNDTELLEAVKTHTIVNPIRHGARVVLPPVWEGSDPLFEGALGQVAD
jgi:hypothetical protein